METKIFLSRGGGSMKVLEKSLLTRFEEILLLLLFITALVVFPFLFTEEPTALGIIAIVLAFTSGLWFGIFLGDRINRHTEALLRHIPMGGGRSIIEDLVVDKIRNQEIRYEIVGLVVWILFGLISGGEDNIFFVFFWMGYLIASPIADRKKNKRKRKSY